jgi:hypothetical protein
MEGERGLVLEEWRSLRCFKHGSGALSGWILVMMDFMLHKDRSQVFKLFEIDYH